MPSVLRRTGPDFMKNGEMKTPRGIVSSCEVCGSPHAPFGILTKDGRYLTYCGQVNGTLQCVNKENG